jgi:hypothetical protein
VTITLEELDRRNAEARRRLYPVELRAAERARIDPALWLAHKRVDTLRFIGADSETLEAAKADRDALAEAVRARWARDGRPPDLTPDEIAALGLGRSAGDPNHSDPSRGRSEDGTEPGDTIRRRAA